MIFSSSTFLVFFIALIAIYASARNYQQRAAILLVGSIIFYTSWKPVYLILLLTSLAFNYWIYRGLLRNPSKVVLSLGVIADLTILAGFKYLALFIETYLWLNALADPAAPIEQSPTWINWALPLGISFYTFQMISALVDSYRGEFNQKISFSKWCLYVSFFPQLIAGPIVRTHELVYQLNSLPPLAWQHVKIGTLIFVGGLLKKVILADNLSPIVNQLYSQPENLDFSLAWLATLAFGLQIYFDFSGYSEMALGLARMFGIILPRNFRYPYISRNFSEFWQRWHITLSQWLRDYLYISLGGSKCSTLKVYRNLLITMLLGGLWHGAGWTFVFWGFLHGAFLIAQRLLNIVFERLGLSAAGSFRRRMSWLGLPVTFVLTNFTWVFFRAPTFDDAWLISGLMMGLPLTDIAQASLRSYEMLIILCGLIVVYAEPIIVRTFSQRGIDWWWRVPFPIRGLSYACLVLVILIFGGSTQEFIYFDF